LAVSICLLHEQSERSLKELRKDTEVCALQKTRCSDCNGQHSAEKNKCFAYNKPCNNCGKLNHFARSCRSAPTQQLGAKTLYQPRTQQRDRIHELDAQPDDNMHNTLFCDPVELTNQKGEIFTTLQLKKWSTESKG